MSSVDSPLALWVVPVPDFGGVARHVVDMAAAGLPGFKLVVLAPTGKLTERLESMGVEVIHADFGPDYGFKTSYASLDAAIDRCQPALVHSHLAYADVVAAAVINARKVRHVLFKSVRVPKLVTTEHGIAGNDTVYHKSSWRSKLMEQVHRVRLWGTDKAIAVSNSTAEQMGAKWGARNVATVYNGVDIDEVRSAVDSERSVALNDEPRLLSLSRLSPEKGIDVLLEAFALLRTDYPQAHLEIAGSGDLADELNAQASRLGLGDSVTFSGFVDPVAAMSRSNILVQLSVWENCSYTLLDARAAGLKVVATAVGGNPEIVESNSLVNRDSPTLIQDVYQALKDQIDSPFSNAFSWRSNAQTAHDTVAIYQNLLEK